MKKLFIPLIISVGFFCLTLEASADMTHKVEKVGKKLKNKPKVKKATKKWKNNKTKTSSSCGSCGTTGSYTESCSQIACQEGVNPANQAPVWLLSAECSPPGGGASVGTVLDVRICKKKNGCYNVKNANGHLACD